MEARLSLQRLEQNIDLQLDQCILKLNKDINDWKELEKANKDNIEGRLQSFKLFQPVLYNCLCNSFNVGFDRTDKKISRVKKISVHLPRFLAYLGIDIKQLKTTLAMNIVGNSLQANIDLLAEWFYDILDEYGYKWWPRCISPSALAEILVIYLENVKSIENDATPATQPKIEIRLLKKKNDHQTEVESTEKHDENANISSKHYPCCHCGKQFTRLISCSRHEFDKHQNLDLIMKEHEIKELSKEMLNKYKRYLIQNMVRLDFTCRFGTCATVCWSEKQRLKHERTVHNWHFHTLAPCDKFLCKFGNNFKEQIHLIETSDKLYQCNRCKSLFESESRLCKHLIGLRRASKKFAITIIDSILSNMFSLDNLKH